MITAIEIENFKAFGERQRIELRPITLLFGPNSGGKSSVAHALHYLREVLVHGNVDAHHTRSGGEALDLGGIRNFVHGRKVGMPIRLKAEFAVSAFGLRDYLVRGIVEGEGDNYELPDEIRSAVRDRITHAAVQLEIDTSDEPMVRLILVELNGVHFAEYSVPRGRPHAEIRRINWLHPCLKPEDVDGDTAAPTQEVQPDGETRGAEQTSSAAGPETSQSSLADDAAPGNLSSVLMELFEQAGGTPVSDSVIQVPRLSGGMPDLENGFHIPRESGMDGTHLPPFEDLLSMLLLGPVVDLREQLRSMRYVGPLRAMPPRHLEPRDQSDRNSWSTGLKAWELLAYVDYRMRLGPEGEVTLLEEVSRWLEDQDRLDTGYRLERETFKQVPANVVAMMIDPEYVDRLEVFAEQVRRLTEQTRVVLRDVGRNLALQPQDVGVGLSQIVPVLVALLEPVSTLVSLEQPELHLHPRQQAALGDALIRGIRVNEDRVLLVETHSEHLILRLLRRIRETTRKQAVAGQALTPDQVRIQYVRRDGGASHVQTIDADVNGDLVDPWPDDFFEQDFKERFS